MAYQKGEIEKKLVELARETEKWARDLHCYRDADSGQIEGVFTIEKTRSKRIKPSWCEHFGESVETWRQVKDKMLYLGIPICRLPLDGHYLGFKGEQGRELGNKSNDVLTRAETIKRHLEYAIQIGDGEEVADYMGKALRDSVDWSKYQTGLMAMCEAIGKPLQGSLAELFLAAGTE